jgi:two-component system, chemotaxis family, chemotaxis protein CheY
MGWRGRRRYGWAMPFASRPSILVVDDSEELRDTLVETLTDEGCEVLAVEDGVQALAALHAGARPQLVLVDLLMPRMNGAQFVAALRCERAFDAVSVVLMSASLESAPPGTQGELRKPFELEALLALVARHCPAQSASPRLAV